MGRPLIPPENLRMSFKVRAQQKIIDELTREAMVEDVTRQQLIEKILVEHVEKRTRRQAAAASKTATIDKPRGRKRSGSRR